MVNERKIAKLLNDLWLVFLQHERITDYGSDGMVHIEDPPEEEKELFNTLLMSCRKDLRETSDLHLPSRLTYWRHPYGDDFFTIGWLDSDDYVTALYTIDAEKDVFKRWPKDLKNYKEYKP